MTDLQDHCRAPIVEWLEKHGRQVEPAGHDRWRFKLNGSTALESTARLSQGWLMLETRLDGGRLPKPPAGADFEKLLRCNAELSGGAKFGLAEDAAQVLLSAEVPLETDDDVDPAGRIGQVCAGFHQGALNWSQRKNHLSSRWRGMASAHTPHRRRGMASAHTPLRWRGIASADTPQGDDDGNCHISESAADAAPAADRELAAVCQQAGWPFTRRASGQIAIQLDVCDAFHQAFLQPGGRSSGLLRVTLGRVAQGSNISRRAIGVLLLSASRVVRMARASVTFPDGAPEYHWEAILYAAASVEQIRHALSALSIACRLTAREVQALEDESTAGEYLSLRGIVS